MAHLIEAAGELDAIRKTLELVVTRGARTGRYLSVANCLVEIPYAESEWKSFIGCREDFLRTLGEVGAAGWRKARRVFTSHANRITKPSYRARLVNYPDRARRTQGRTGGINQVEVIAESLRKSPGAACLSFVILRPADLLDMFRSSYVPCPLAGDFKFRSGQLHLSVFFRSFDALAVAYPDIFYLRKLQEEVLQVACRKPIPSRLRSARIGTLALHLSRVYLARTIEMVDERRVDGLPLAKKLIRRLARLTRDSQF
jgi:hypothetical protein